MPAISDLVASLDKKMADSASNGVGALDQLSESLQNIDFKAVAAGNKKLEASQKALATQLMLLKKQASDNIKTNDDLLRRGKVSSKKAQAIASRQAAVMLDLNEKIQDLGKVGKVGADEMSQMAKAARKVNKELLEEAKLQQSINRGSREFIRNQKRQAMVWVKSLKRIEEAQSGIQNLTNKLGADYVGSGIVRAGQESAERSGNKKAIMGMGIVGLFLAVMSKATEGRQKELAAFSPKAFNYGLQGFDNLNQAIMATGDTLTRFRDSALHLGMDMDQANQLFTEVGAQTGETNENLEAMGPIIFRAIQAGIIPAGEAASKLAERINTVGISAKDAAMEIEDIGIIAKGVGSVQMEDLYKSVNNVAGASEELVSNQRDLAKVMGGLIRQGDKLGMSYNRRLRAAEALTKALSANYNQGFATLEIEQDLAIAQQARAHLSRNASKAEIKQAEEFARKAAEIAQMRREGRIDDARAAELLKEAGGSTNKALMQERLSRSVVDIMGPGGVRRVESRIGKLSVDSIALLNRIGKIQQQTGKSVGDILQSDKFLSKRDREAYKRLSKEVGKEGLKGKMGVQAMVDKIMNLLKNVIAPALKYLPEVLDQLIWSFNKTVSYIKKIPFFRADTKEDIAEKRKQRVDERYRDSVLRKLAAATGDKGATIEDLLTDESVAEKYKTKFRGLRKEEIEAIKTSDYGAKHLSKVLKLASTMSYSESQKEEPKVKSVMVKPGRMRPDGNQDVEVTIRGTNIGADRAAQQSANLMNSTARDSSRVP